MNAVLVWAGSLVAIALYIPLIRGIFRDEVKQSFATWILWVLLDAIALVSIILQHGNYLLLFFYVIGGTLVTLSLLYKKQFKWTWFETFVSILVVICLVIWWMSGSKMATIASTLAVFIAGVPQIVESWQKPDRNTGYIYVGYVLANALSFLGGKTWTIEERFYPGVCVVLCSLIAIASLRRIDALKAEEKIG